MSMGKADWQRVMDIAALCAEVKTPQQLRLMVRAVGRLVPHEFGAIGSFTTANCDHLEVNFTTYHPELSNLYVAEGFRYDPSIALIRSTKAPYICSVDKPYMTPRPLEEVKLDFGIRTCLSLGVRGESGRCTYMAFSNFDQAEQPKLRELIGLLAPHIHLASMRCRPEQDPNYASVTGVQLSKKEAEVVKWLCEGKSNWEIATILHMTERAVRYHLTNIYEKLGAEYRAQVIANYQWSEAGLLRKAAPTNSQVIST
jgi:DNA-binding CsgD family transcriptional regulator